MNEEHFTLWAVRLPKSFLDKMREIKKETHIKLAEQVRIALRDYFEKVKKNG